MKRNLLLSLSFILCSLFAFAQTSEDFEGGLPEGWTAENAWRFGNAASLGSQYFPVSDRGNFACANDDALGAGMDGSGRLISAPIDLTAASGVLVLSHAAFFFNADYQGADETAKVQISTDGGSTWTTVRDLDGAGDWQESKVVISEYAGEVINVAFEYTDGNEWNYGYCVDDFAISVVTKAKDLILTDVSAEKFIKNNGDVSVSLSVLNDGFEDVASFDVSVEDAAGNAVMTTVTPMTAIAFGESYTFDLASSFDVTDAKKYDFTVAISNINGGADEDDSNNAGAFEVTSVADAPPVKMVAEEATGTWCGWCPRGAVWMEYMEETYPDAFIGIAVHNADPMVVTEYDNALGDTPGFSGYPSVVVERASIIDPSQLENVYLARANRVSPLGATFTQNWDVDTRTITVNASASAHTVLSGDYRLSLVITEDEVTGTASEYNQANFYSGGGAGALNGYENLPNPVPAADMVYEQVARAIVGGHAGVAGSLPANMVSGDVVPYEFTYVLPSTMDEKHVNLIVLVLDAETGNILNGANQSLNLMPSSAQDLPTELSEILISPNPTRDVATLEVNVLESSDIRLELVDMYGRLVNARTYNNVVGDQVFPIVKGNLAAGTYLVRLSTNGKSITKKVSFID